VYKNTLLGWFRSKLASSIHVCTWLYTIIYRLHGCFNQFIWSIVYIRWARRSWIVVRTFGAGFCEDPRFESWSYLITLSPHDHSAARLVNQRLSGVCEMPVIHAPKTHLGIHLLGPALPIRAEVRITGCSLNGAQPQWCIMFNDRTHFRPPTAMTTH
jgi:hypothetical protein